MKKERNHIALRLLYDTTNRQDKGFFAREKTTAGVACFQKRFSQHQDTFFHFAVPFRFAIVLLHFPLTQSLFSCYIHYSKERKKKQVYESKNIYIFLGVV